MLSRLSRSLSPVRSPAGVDPAGSRLPRSDLSTSHYRARSKSLKATIVRSLKTSITKATKRGAALYTQCRSTLESFDLDSPSPISPHPAQSRAAATLLLDLKKSAHTLGGLQGLITSQFNAHSVLDHPDRDTLYAEVLAAHREAGVDHVLLDVNHGISCLDAALRANGVTITPFVPNPSDPFDDDEPRAAEGGASTSAAALTQPLTTTRTAPESPPSDSPILGLRVRDPPLSGQHSDDLLDFQHQLSVSEDAIARMQQTIRDLTDQQFAREQEHRKELRDRREAEFYKTQQVVTLEKELELVRFQESHTRRLLDESISHKVATAMQAQFALENSHHHCKTDTAGHVTTDHRVPPLPPIAESFSSGFRPKSFPSAPTAPRTTVPLPTPHTKASVEHGPLYESSVMAATKHQLEFEKRMEGYLSRKLAHVRAPVNESAKVRDRTESENSEYIRRYEDCGDDDDASVASGVAPTHQTNRHCPLPPSNRNESSSIPAVSNLKLESKLKMLPHFDGTSDFDDFMDTMRTTVFSQPITADDKLFLLKNHLSGPARNCIAPSRDSATALAKTLESLDKVYGKKNSRQQLLKQLQKLSFHRTNAEEMRSDLAALSGLVERLHGKGLPMTDENTSWTIARKLPEEMMKGVARFMRKYGDDVTHLQILDRISDMVESKAMEQNIMDNGIGGYSPTDMEITDHYAFLNPISANHQRQSYAGQPSSRPQDKAGKRPLVYIAEQHPAHYFDQTTQSQLEGIYAPGPKGVNLRIIHRSFPFANEEIAVCNVCQGTHNAIRCPLSSMEFRAMCKSKGLCPICAGKHDITQCRSAYRCGYCDGLHHMGGCPLKEYYRNMKNYPQGAKKPETFFRSSGNKRQ